VTQDSFAAPSATGMASFQTLTCGLRRVTWRHALTIGFSRDLPAGSRYYVSVRSSRAAAAHLSARILKSRSAASSEP
jgi:hypothetical protein